MIPMPIRIDSGASCARSAAGERGIARNVIPKALTNAAAASPPVSARTPTASRAPDARKQRLKEEPFADEAVQRGQAGDGQRAGQETGGRPGHAADQAAEQVHVAGARGVEDGSRAEKEQSLECGVVQGVVERGREREEGRRGDLEAPEEEPGAEADEDETDVLDARIGEEALEVVLHERVEHADDRRERPEADQQGSPPGRPPAEQVQADAEEPVHAELDHHARHEGGDVARRRRVSARQPDVERDDAGLGAEPQKREQEHRVAGRRRERGGRRAQIAEVAGHRARREEQEGREQEGQSRMGHG
jgi:hypothetical protein